MQHCDLFAAPVSAPPVERHVDHGCATFPSPKEFAARCDATANRCVLERTPAPSLETFALTLSCDLYGTVITNDTIVVKTAPPSIHFEGTGRPTRDAELTAADLVPLGQLLASPGFDAFVTAEPPEGPPHPGMTKCTLDVESPAVTVKSKRWTTAHEFGAVEDETRKSLHEHLGTLQRRLPG